MVTLLPIFAFGLIIALSLIIIYQFEGLLFTTATECLIKTYYGLHFVEVVGDF